MIYNYYMKINIWCFFFSVFFVLFPSWVSAQLTVVRVEDARVFLDTSESKVAVKKGDNFKVILSSESLINPKTGKDLGLVHNYTPEGKIIEVQPLYAIGELPTRTTVTVGQEAVLISAPVSSIKATPGATAAAITPTSSRTIVRYAPVEAEVVSLSEGAVTSETAQNVVTLSAQGKVQVWTRSNDQLRENMSYELPSGITPLAISVASISRAEKADIFVSFYDNRKERISTTVLREENGKLVLVDTMPYFVKELGCGSGKKVWAQRPFVIGSRPGNAYTVFYEGGHFRVTDTALATQRNWLPGVHSFAVEKPESQNFLYTASNGRIRMNLSNGKRAESKDLFASTPNRVKYKQEILKFYPSLQIFTVGGKAVIAGVENTTKAGLLTSTFGQYQNGKIHFLQYDKGRLVVTDSIELDGVVYDTACTNNAILAAEVLADDTSSLVEIFK